MRGQAKIPPPEATPGPGFDLPLGGVKIISQQNGGETFQVEIPQALPLSGDPSSAGPVASGYKPPQELPDDNLPPTGPKQGCVVMPCYQTQLIPCGQPHDPRVPTAQGCASPVPGYCVRHINSGSAAGNTFQTEIDIFEIGFETLFESAQLLQNVAAIQASGGGSYRNSAGRGHSRKQPVGPFIIPGTPRASAAANQIVGAVNPSRICRAQNGACGKDGALRMLHKPLKPAGIEFHIAVEDGNPGGRRRTPSAIYRPGKTRIFAHFNHLRSISSHLSGNATNQGVVHDDDVSRGNGLGFERDQEAPEQIQAIVDWDYGRNQRIGLHAG